MPASPKLDRLRKRSEFLEIARLGEKYVMPGVVVQGKWRRAALSESMESPSMRAGFTATKKLGNAVARNRAKRRLREAARKILPLYGLPGADYVLIGRQDTATCPYARLLEDVARAVKQVSRRLTAQRANRDSAAS